MSLKQTFDKAVRGVANRCKYIWGQNIKNCRFTGFLIYVDNEDPIHVDVHPEAMYTFISDTDTSVAVRVDYPQSSTSHVVLVKWSNYIKDINTKDHISSVIARHVAPVPTYISKKIYAHGYLYVGITVREYIHGTTLDRVWNDMSVSDQDVVYSQIEAIICNMSHISSPYFGHIQDGRCRTTTAHGYLRHHIEEDVLADRITSMPHDLQGDDAYQGVPSLCHMRLTQDHIIVEGTEVVGIVGWSSADFVPEVMDRVRYYFESSAETHCWNRRLADVVAYTSPPSIGYVIKVCEYFHALYKGSTTRGYDIRKLWAMLKNNYTIVTCLTAATTEEGDMESLCTLIDSTIDFIREDCRDYAYIQQAYRRP